MFIESGTGGINVDNHVQERLKNPTMWTRALHMLVFVIAYGLAISIVIVIMLYQLVSVILTGGVNEMLLRLGNNLSTYLHQIFRFLTFNTDTAPFPFAPWPDEPAEANPWLTPEADPLDEDPTDRSAAAPDAQSSAAPASEDRSSPAPG